MESLCPQTSTMSVGLGDMSVYEATDTEGTFKPSNPFHDDPKTENSLLDIALENLQIITCRKGPSTYIIGQAVHHHKFNVQITVLVHMQLDMEYIFCAQKSILARSVNCTLHR